MSWAPANEPLFNHCEALYQFLPNRLAGPPIVCTVATVY